MMKNMTLRAITEACGGTYVGTPDLESREVESIVIDSRQVEAGGLYIPIVGERVDGHSFIPDVIEKGAIATLTEHPLPGFDTSKAAYIQVASTKQALKDIAAYYRTVSGVKVIGVTGSVGKTSTKEMLAAVLGQKYHVLKTEGNFNNEIGLPLTVFKLRPEHDIAILEMGIDSFGEMHRLSEVAKPDICVITNIGYCHLENLGDRNGVLRAKTEIFDFLQPGGRVVLNGDDDKLRTIAKVKGEAPIFYGLENQASGIYADHVVEDGLAGVSADLHMGMEVVSVHIPIPGKHMVQNALAGIAVGQLLGMTLEEMAAGIATLKAVSGRNNQIQTDSITIIDDCYNANPVSVKASVDVLSLVSGRKVALLGDMFELGREERSLHAQVGEYTALHGIDVICFTGNLSKDGYDAATRISANPNIYYFGNKEAMLQALTSILQKGDTVLVKASHGMEFDQVVSWLREQEFPEVMPTQSAATATQHLEEAPAPEVEPALKQEQPAITTVEKSWAGSFSNEASDVKENEQETTVDMATKPTTAVIIFGLLAMLLNVVLIGNAMGKHSFNLNLSYYFVLFALTMSTVLCGYYGDKGFRIFRGILMLVVLELMLVVKQSEIQAILSDISSISSLTNWVYALWYVFVSLWLLAEGIKAIFLPESRAMLYLCDFLNGIHILVGVTVTFLLYDYYKSQSIISTITQVDMWQVYMMLIPYVVFVFLGLAHMVLSAKETEQE
jgi:UDP-N-acetylmuramoyl-tripeptide--D-alanyl-D-alanine ligase